MYPFRRRLAIERLENRCLLTCLVPENTCFAVIGDYGDAGQPEQDVAELVKSWNPDFIITVGDNNYTDGAAATIDENIGQYYQDYIYPYTGSFGPGSDANRFFPALGNHDWNAPGAKPYFDYFTLPGNERYYKFTWGPVELFSIDSDGSEPDGNTSTSVQAAWLESQLAASTATWKLVYMHHPPYSSGELHGSDADMQWPFQEWGATAVLAGHEHLYERIVLNGFPYFVNGLGGRNVHVFTSPVTGSTVRYDSDYGAMLVDASDTQVTFRFVSRAGTIADIYTITTSDPLPTVSIAATDPSASEAGTDAATLIVSRTGDASDELAVGYTVTGSATNGLDYDQLNGVVTIPAGAMSVPLDIVPIDDTDAEWFETVIVTLSSSTVYNIVGPMSDVVSIEDDEVTIPPIAFEIQVTDSLDDAEEADSGSMSLAAC